MVAPAQETGMESETLLRGHWEMPEVQVAADYEGMVSSVPVNPCCSVWVTKS
jgi:hypothetical protein